MTESTHTPTLEYAAPPVAWRESQIPHWAWLLAILAFPMGMFIALAGIRVLRWRSAILLALLSYLSGAAFVPVLAYADEHHVALLQSAALFTLMAILAVWGLVIFRLGRAAGVWSPGSVRAWKLVGIFIAILASLLLTAAALAGFHR